MEICYLVTLLKNISEIMSTNKEKLIAMDSVVGDGDLGLTMSDGFSAAYEAVKDGSITDAGRLLFSAGKAMASKVPSTMGSLMAAGLKEAGKALKGKDSLDLPDIIQIFISYEEGVANLGGAKIGEKTFLDGIHPANEAMKTSLQKGDSLQTISEKAAAAALAGFESTTSLLAVHGRAATRGELSRKLEDPGAYVAYLIMLAFKDSIK